MSGINPWFTTPFTPNDPLPRSVSVAIVGGSFAALYLSSLLSKAQIRTAVFSDRDELAGGWDRRSLGQVRMGLGDNLYRLQLALGDAHLGELLRFSHRSVEILQELDCFTPTGGIELANNPREKQELEQAHHISTRLGFPSMLWDEATILSKIKAKSCLLARYSPMEGYIDPTEVTQTLLKKQDPQWASIHTGMPIHAIQGHYGNSILVHDQGETAAEVLVFVDAQNLCDIEPFFINRLCTLRTQAIAYHHAENPMPYSCSTQYGYVNWRDRGTLRLLHGCRWATPHLELGETDDSVIVPLVEKQLIRFAQKHFAHDPTIRYRWSGIENHSCDGLPLIGTLPGRDDQLICTAFQGRSVGLSLAAAECLADILLEGFSDILPSLFLTKRLYG